LPSRRARRRENKRWGGRDAVAEGGDRGVDPPARQRAKANAFEEADFKAAQTLAVKARGFPRVLEYSIRVGDEVRLFGWDGQGERSTRSSAGESAVVGETVGSPLTPVIATFDPRAWLRRRAWGARLAALVIVLSAVAVTVPMFVGEPFGLEAKVGALAAVIVFNLQQLWLKFVRDHTREPSQCHVRGTWSLEAPRGT